MYPLVTRCPVCQEEFHVTRLTCESCGSVLEGHFDLGPLARLSSEQLRFVEVFLRCEGKINRVQEELNMSYPTVRSRLTDVLKTLGYSVQDTESGVAMEPSEVLDELAAGRLSVDEAIKLLKHGRE